MKFRTVLSGLVMTATVTIMTGCETTTANNGSNTPSTRPAATPSVGVTRPAASVRPAETGDTLSVAPNLPAVPAPPPASISTPSPSAAPAVPPLAAPPARSY